MSGLQIVFEGIRDSATKSRIETALRVSIGDPPENAEWNVTVTSYGSYCTVLLEATQQTRRMMFFLAPEKLPEAITMWLKQYPVR